MEKKSRIYIILSVVFVIGAWFFLMRKPKPVPESVVEGAPSTAIKILDEKAIEEQTRGRDYMQLVQWDQTERKIDLKRTALPIVNGEAIIDVEVATKGTCYPGDANAIEMDLKSMREFKLLATIESLSGRGNSLSWDVPKDFLSKGSATKEFKLPVKQEPSQYGFFLCTARSGDKSCQDKKVRDVNEIFTEHLTKTGKLSKEPRNIFFQYFMLDDRGLAAFAGVPQGNEKFEQLKKYTKERNVNGNVESEVEVAKKNIHTLLSLPFAFNGKKIKVELPQYNMAVCAQERK